MDISSSFVATITPPPFQKAAEEARHDTRAREIVPSLNQTANSNKSSRAAEDKGGSEANASTLQQTNSANPGTGPNAVFGKSEDGQKGRRDQQGENERGKEEKEGEKKENSNVIKTSVFINSKTKLFISAPTPKDEFQQLFVKSIADLSNDSKNSILNEFEKRNNAIAKRYASILPAYDRGKVVSVAV